MRYGDVEWWWLCGWRRLRLRTVIDSSRGNGVSWRADGENGDIWRHQSVLPNEERKGRNGQIELLQTDKCILDPRC